MAQTVRPNCLSGAATRGRFGGATSIDPRMLPPMPRSRLPAPVRQVVWPTRTVAKTGDDPSSNAPKKPAHPTLGNASTTSPSVRARPHTQSASACRTEASSGVAANCSDRFPRRRLGQNPICVEVSDRGLQFCVSSLDARTERKYRWLPRNPDGRDHDGHDVVVAELAAHNCAQGIPSAPISFSLLRVTGMGKVARSNDQVMVFYKRSRRMTRRRVAQPLSTSGMVDCTTSISF